MAESTKQTNETANQGADNVKVMAALAYVLFFIPLLTNPNDEFAKFHANQGLNLLLLAIAVQVIGWAIPFLGWFLIVPLGSIAVLVLFIMGIINALNGEKKALPVIGQFQLLK